LLSENNGASPAIQSNSEPFTISTVLTLTVGSTAPRKEAGLRINSSPASGVGDTLFLVNSDAREIVAFGGGASFFSFGSGATGYTLGSPILMGMRYTPGSPSTLEYFIDRDPSTPGGIESSGPLPYSNLENGPVDYQVGVYGQVSPANAQDFIRAEFASINAVIPEPASAGVALAGLAAIGALRRRSR
jgi:MYXO-CTERM domain-containing protein